MQAKSVKEIYASQLPPSAYEGTYVNTIGEEIRAVAKVVYMGSEGDSATVQPFFRIPKLRMELTICLGSRPIMGKKLVLASLDYLRNRGTFAPENQGTERIYTSFGKLWQTIDGEMVSAPDDPQDPSGTRTEVHLKAMAKGSDAPSCQR
jgi:hypothetical protein